MLIHWIWLAQCQGMSDWEKGKLLQHFGDPEDIYHSAPAEIQAFLGASHKLPEKDLSEARKILDKCSHSGISILTYRDASYPVRLKNIPDPPLVLYYKGTLPEFDSLPAIGVVGTRKASAYGLQTAKQMGYQIGSCGGLVVSGLASGVDSMAMIGALAAESSVVGILGCGIDVVYPRSSQELYADTQRYGCILSEFAPGTPPNPWHFPRRNRIISGLSCGVLVVEAPQKSGALITARQAADQGRDVFVVPGNIDNASCAGSNHLLRDGAIAVSSGWDVMSEYEARFPNKVRRSERGYPDKKRGLDLSEPKEKPEQISVQKPGISLKKEILQKENDKKVIDKEQSAPYSDVNDILPKLSADEQKVVKTLLQGQRLVDDVIAETGLTTGRVLAILTMLELKKVIIRHPGKRITLK